MLHIAFLGCGFAAELHGKTLAHFRDTVRISFASRSPEKAEAFREKFRGYRSYTGYDAALQDPEVDAVMILTPPASHLDLTLATLQAGKHAIVEKPPFLHSEDFATVGQAAQNAGRQVMIAENYFYKPLRRKLAEVIREGRIGRPLFLHLNAVKQQQTADWRDQPELSGGGALFEGGIHWISFLNQLGWQLDAVRGFLPHGENPGKERSILVGFNYQEGPAGMLSYSWDVPSWFKGLRISRLFGSKGSVTFETNGVFLMARAARPVFCFPGLRDLTGYRAMFADFLPALRENRQPAFTLEMARKDIETIERISKQLQD